MYIAKSLLVFKKENKTKQKKADSIERLTQQVQNKFNSICAEILINPSPRISEETQNFISPGCPTYLGQFFLSAPAH